MKTYWHLDLPLRTECRRTNRSSLAAVLFCVALVALFALPVLAQEPQYNPPPPPPPVSGENPSAQPPAQPAPHLDAKQLDDLVSRIALYPDPLLAQVLTASTYSYEIPEASAWANEHSNLHGDALANAIREDNVQWDPCVMALLPFPSVLNTMAQDLAWTERLGDAVLAQRPDVMDAVQRMRRQSYQYGYLRSNPYDNVVDSSGDIEILPLNPAYIYVPAYDPLIVFGPPSPGFFIGGAIRFGPAIVIGAAFAPWGWAHPYFEWRTHGIFFDATPWGRGWVNRGYYVHPYAHAYVSRPGPRVEMHGPRRR